MSERQPNIIRPTGALTQRSGQLAVPSAKVTEGELKNIERALLNPPKKVDPWLAGIGLLSSGFFAIKTLSDTHCKPEGANLAALLAACALFGGVVLDIIRRLNAKDPHHDAALEDVRALMGKPPNGDA